MEYVYILLNPNEILPSPESIRSLEEFLKESELIGPEAHPAQSRPAQSRPAQSSSSVSSSYTFMSCLSQWLKVRV